MELNNKNRHFNLENILGGVSDGFKMSIDILGTVYSVFTNTKTTGGRGLRGEDIYGTRNPAVDYHSMTYNGSKFIGAMVGVVAQVETIFIPKIFLTVRNYNHYEDNKKEDKEKFE